jgi:catecholate siderophore receptor
MRSGGFSNPLTWRFSHGSSFDPSAEGIESLISSGRAVAQANLNLDPEKSRSYELGSKWSVLGGRMLLTGALFRLEKTNVRVPDPSIPGFNILGGDQRVDGVEIEAVGKITATINLRAGYSYLDSDTTRSIPGGPLVGRPLPLTARNTASLFVECRPITALELGLGSSATSSRLGQNTAAQYEVAPGYAIFDAFAKYSFNDHFDTQINIRNIGNKNYADQLHPHVIMFAKGRLSVDFDAVVPSGHYFFMGDNRNDSEDNRFAEVGFIPQRLLIGRAMHLAELAAPAMAAAATHRQTNRLVARSRRLK